MLRAFASTSPCLLVLAWLAACAKPDATAIPPPAAGDALELAALDEDDDLEDDEDEDDGAESSAPRGDQGELARLTLPARPSWMDKYAGSSPDERFFDIAALMKAHDLDRAKAVELQNHFRDLSRAEPGGDRQAQFAEALRRAKAGEFEDGRDPERIAKAPFIVVFDLDETLYDQKIEDPAVAKTCHDLEVPQAEGKPPRLVKLNPGWADAIRRIDALGGEVVLFSANLDDSTWANVRAWTLDGVPLHQHPAVAAFMTNSHLVLQPKNEGQPVVEPSKDLRILDEELTRTIIVDDNPLRLFQFRNTRVFKKFEADTYCTTKDAATKRAYEQALSIVVDEIEDSVRYMKAHRGVTFARAYLPYTTLGQHAVHWLSSSGRSEVKAIAHLRAHPELADARF